MLLVYFIIILIFSLLFIHIPLFNYLGYEFSTAVAFIICIIGGILTHQVFRKQIKTLPYFGIFQFSRTLKQIFKQGFLLLLVPLFVSTANIFFVKNCSYLEGILFYLLIPTVTLVWSVGLSMLCTMIFKRPIIMFFTFIFVTLLHPIYIGYTTPQIYSYNFIYGYFPGFSYDEVLEITPTLVLFRFITLITAVFMILLASFFFRYSDFSSSLIHKIRSFSNFKIINLHNTSILLLGAILVVIWLFRIQLGFESSAEMIQQHLGSKFVTENFEIFYSAKSFSHNDIQFTAAEHEFRYHQIKKVLGVERPKKIRSYIYPNSEIKGKFIGASTTNIAKPWLNEIHLNKESYFNVLKHELVHILAADFGMPIIKAHYNLGLVEGLATAIDGKFGNRTLHEYAAGILKFGIVKNPEQLISPTGFAFHFSSLSYCLMGSFCRYLIDCYGIDNFKKLYGGENVKAVYNHSYSELINEWREHILKIQIPLEWQSHIEFYFNRPTIFSKTCARTIAKYNQKAYRLLTAQQSEEAFKIFSKSLKSNWNTEAFNGLVRTAYLSGQYDTIIHLMHSYLKDTLYQKGISNLFIEYGDALWCSGDIHGARGIYKKLLEYDLSERLNEAVSVRLAVLEHDDIYNNLFDYFAQPTNDSITYDLLNKLRHQSNSPILDYLEARLLFKRKDFEMAKQKLEQIQTGLESNILMSALYRKLGEANFYTKNFQQAIHYFKRSNDYTINKASIEMTNDWIERCEWYEINSPIYLK